MKGEAERTRALSLQKYAPTHTCACSYRQASSDGLREKSIKRVQGSLDL